MNDVNNELSLNSTAAESHGLTKMDRSLPNNLNEKKHIREFAEHLRKSVADKNEKLPEAERLDPAIFTDEFVESVLKVFVEETKWQLFLDRLRRPAFLVRAFALLCVPVAFVVGLVILLPAWVTILWGLPMGIAALLSIPYWREIQNLFRQRRKLADLDRQSGDRWMEGIVDFTIDHQKAFRRHQDRTSGRVSVWLESFFLPYTLPIAAFELVGRRYAGYFAVIRFVPVNLNLLWDIVFLVCSFVVARNGFPYGGFYLATTVGAWAVQSLLSSFKVVGVGKYRTTNWLSLQRESFSLSPFLQRIAVVVISFGSCYYATSIADPSAFKQELTVVDAIYFSVVTAATVGFGDITPVSTAAKVICMFEIVCSFAITVFVIATVVAFWQQSQLGPPPDSNEPSLPNAEVAPPKS